MRELLVMRKLRAHFVPELEWKRQLERERKWTPKFESRLRSVMKRQAEIAIQRLVKRGLRQRATAFEIGEDIFPLTGWEDLFERVVDPVRTAAFAESATAATTAISGKAFVFTEAAQSALALQNAAHITFVNETTRSSIVQALDAGLGEGESVDQIAKRIAEVFGKRKRDTRRIARTEMAGAVSEAQAQGYKQTGVVEKKQWNDSQDGDEVRESHRINGTSVGLDEDFTLANGSQGSAPGSPDFSAADRINCRCFLTPQFFDEDKAGLAFPVAAGA